MNIKKTLLASLALTLGWGGTTFAQSEADALRYTRLGITGSARVQGIGGAQVALGADPATIALNPAGLGMFRRSEFSFSPGIQSTNTQATVGGFGFSDDRSVLSFPHLGLVVSSRKGDEDEGDWRGANFGVSLTRLNNFNQRINYRSTVEPPNTIVDYFAEQAAGRTEADLDAEFDNFTTLAGLAYGTFLINFQDEFGRPTTNAQPIYSLGQIEQQEEIQRRSSQNQLDIGVGTSFRDRIYLGASLGIVTTTFKQESIFREGGYYVDQYTVNETTGEAEIVLDGDYSLELRDEFTAEGNGINLKIGVIARPIDALRLGLSVQTPTAYTFTDTYQRSLQATTLNPATAQPETNTATELPGEFTYRLTTPFRATAGLAFFIGKYGFVTGDVEFVDYSDMRFSEDDDVFGSSGNFFTDVNSRISNTYRSAVNYRLGAEGRYEVFRLRAGYAHTADPYKNAAFDGEIQTYTLGTGVRLKNYYADLAYVRSKGNTRYSPYVFSTGGEPVVDLQEKRTTVMLTLGYNF